MTDEFGDCAGMPDAYRGWKVSYACCPTLDQPGSWQGISPGHGTLGQVKTNDWFCIGNILEAATREELIAAIDAWILENGQ